MKNIPIPPNNIYMKTLIKKVEEFTRRLRWRAHFFLRPETKTEQKETYGFKSQASPPYIPQLKDFEDDLLKMIENIRFRKISSPLQNKLREDTKRMKQEENILTPADKTNNYYLVSPQHYSKLMKDNITSTYKRADQNTAHSINLEAKKIADTLKLSDRIDVMAAKPSYITLKDHKENFRNHPTCRLINPNKSEIGIISKQILDKINTVVCEATKVNQWKNSTSVIRWFNNIHTTDKSTFITFDVVNFYPSINRELLLKALQFAQKFTNITSTEKDIILHAKNTLLFHNSDPWQKSDSDDLFDVTMGSYDGAETCELVGTYILNEINNIIPKENIGLYRDDGLSVINKPPSIAERIKKKLCERFKQLGLQITATSNTTVTDFLDLTFDLLEKKYQPYSKPGNSHLYVHTESNHPPIITKRIPRSIETRLSKISSDKQIFDKVKPTYEKALKEAGHSTTLNYQPNCNSQNSIEQRNRKRNITWFNPPYSKHVSTNIGNKFLSLVKKHFPKEHELNKICNKNTLKISYSCMPNMESIIKSCNNKLTANNTPKQELCNCRKKESCPLPGKCKTKNIIYEATVKTQEEEKSYIGLTATTFKERYQTHLASFKNREKRQSTELSKYIRTQKDNNKPYEIKWKILKHAQPYSPKSKKCNLCLWEKYHIITANKCTTLNKRTELHSACRHRKKFLLSEYG